MTSPQPRRPRRRDLPAESLPRLRPEEERERRRIRRTVAAGDGERRHAIQHHVVSDYSHVRADLLTVAVVTAIASAFVVAMSFVL